MRPCIADRRHRPSPKTPKTNPASFNILKANDHMSMCSIVLALAALLASHQHRSPLSFSSPQRRSPRHAFPGSTLAKLRPNKSLSTHNQDSNPTFFSTKRGNDPASARSFVCIKETFLISRPLLSLGEFVLDVIDSFLARQPPKVT